MVRAKFRVTSVTRTEGWQKDEHGKPKELQTIKLSPVSSSDPNSENAKFWAATPSGQIELGTVNADAAKQFEIGKEYYVDFTPAAA